MAYTKTTGIVLRRSNFGEADRLITFLTPELGKVKAIAKGVRRIKSRMAGHLELFGEVSIMLASGRNLDVITSARLQQSFGAIANDYSPLTYGYLFAEMVDRLTPEASPQPQVYEVLRGSYEELSHNRGDAVLETYFKLGLLDGLGYRPDLETCMICRRPLSGPLYFLNAELGGIMDSACSVSGPYPMIQNEIKLWRLILDHPVEQVRRLEGSAKLAQMGLKGLDSMYDYHFGHRFKSRELLST